MLDENGVPTIKKTWHVPVSESLAFCTANSPGNLSNKKYALLENTVSSDHRFAALGSRSRISTLEREGNALKCYRNKKKGKQLKFIASRILINSF